MPSPRPIQPMPSFVFPFDAHARRIDAERGGESRAHRVAVRREPRRFGDDADIDLAHARTPRCSIGAPRPRASRSSRVPCWRDRCRGTSRRCRPAGGAENRVGDRVTDGVAVGVAVEVDVRWDGNAAEDQWAAGGEPVRVVADADADGGVGLGGGDVPRALRGICSDWRPCSCERVVRLADRRTHRCTDRECSPAGGAPA